MSITALSFILFLLLICVAYFSLPHKYQWKLLLFFSCVFYMTYEPKYIVFVLITAVSIFFAAKYMDTLLDRQKTAISEKKQQGCTAEERKEIKKQFQKKKRTVLVLTLCLNFGLLIFFKYSVFFSHQISSIFSLFGVEIPVLKSIVAPLGISFYTFQSTGYLIDVYWENYKSEKNIGKMLLFTSFFPQIIQGPINRYDLLSQSLFTEHSFDYKRFSYGCQRMLWGFIKKIVVADRLLVYVSDAFENYKEYSGLMLLFGAFLYSIQIYADFSGYMDIFCGFCEILGVQMSENFERPYFSKSVAEYWRRWHITLGTWFKDYLYYPIALSKFSKNAAKKGKRIFGKFIGQNIPAVIALVCVWFLTGFWHGASWNYIAWGGLNGFFIILSILMEPLYKKAIKALKINEKSWLWRAFQTVRTFGLVTLIKVFPEIGDFDHGVAYMTRMFTTLSIPTNFRDILLPQHANWDYICIFFSIACIFIVSLIQRKLSFRDFLSTKPIVIRWAVYIGELFFLILFGGSVVSNGGFLYAQF